MRTKNFMKHLVAGALALASGQVAGQASVLGNSGGPAHYLGWDNTNNFPLMVRHNANQPIQWYTDAVQRMRLMPTLTGQTVNTYTGLDLSGHLGLGGPVPTRPLAYIHINSNGSHFAGYRPWMRVGTFMSENNDGMYVGTKREDDDRIDAVLNWFDNDQDSPGVGPDALRFIFTRTSSGSSVAAGGDGLEMARVIPASNGNEGFFGIGDFFTPGLQPAERLDVLNGRVRIRQLPDDPQYTGTYKVLVVDDATAPSGERGVIKWVAPSSLPGGAGCEWILQNNGVSGPSVPHNVYTAEGLSNDCPDKWDAVGVGTNAPKAKLDVFTTTPGFFGNDVIAGQYKSDQSGGRAVSGSANSALTTTFSNNTLTGVQGSAENGKKSIGVLGVATIAAESPGTAEELVGVRGLAKAYGSATSVIGVYGAASGALNPSDNWAGYFAGNVNVTGTGYYLNGVFLASDGQFKTNVQDLDDALGIVMQLQPHRYDFATGQYPQLDFPSGPQAGLLAQELEAVLPGLVRDARIGATVDTAGNVIYPAMDYKAVNYAGLVPYLIGALQQQQAQLADLQAKVANCCAADQGMAPQDVPMQKDAPQTGDVQEQRLLVIPNPVADLTMLEYYVPKAGKVSLSVSTGDGKPMGTLREELAEPGAYRCEWNTTKLAAGTYFCTFLLDGNVVVKRAVKVK
ncbi:MAG: tail fiber domain-containing protein [Flavobacteriales bacterium]|nr:tail fiber domain-containing protein [Flavobacteriales bacterium]